MCLATFFTTFCSHFHLRQNMSLFWRQQRMNLRKRQSRAENYVLQFLSFFYVPLLFYVLTRTQCRIKGTKAKGSERINSVFISSCAERNLTLLFMKKQIISLMMTFQYNQKSLILKLVLEKLFTPSSENELNQLLPKQISFLSITSTKTSFVYSKHDNEKVNLNS